MMDELERIFSEGLKQHRVSPPPEPWETLARRLHHRRRKRRVAYGSVAAACLLMLVAGITFYPSDEPPTWVSSTPARDSIKTLSKKLKLADSQNFKPNKIQDTLSSISRQPPVELATVARLPTAPTVASPPSETPTLRVPPTLVGGAETKTMNPGAASEKAPYARTLVVAASRYRKVPRDSVSKEAPASVTIIYQPNPATLAQQKSFGRKVTRALTQIKASRVSLGELRSAKDDLVDKVLFDREPDESLEYRGSSSEQ